MKGTFTIKSADLIRTLSNAAVFAGKDDTLPVLKAVRVEVTSGENCEGTLTAVATDRYCIGIDTADVSGVTTDMAMLLDLDDVQRLVKAVKSSGKPSMLTNSYVVVWVEDDNRVKFDYAWGDSSLTFRQVDGEFPKYRSLIPDEDTLSASDGVSTIAFNPAYLARFDKVDRGSRTAPITLRFVTPTKPAVVRAGDTFTGLIMPVRLAG